MPFLKTVPVAAGAALSEELFVQNLGSASISFGYDLTLI
jgi:hypothetical protein